MSNIGIQIRNARKKLGITQAVLADKIGKSFNQIAKWERGEVKIGLDVAIDIAHALNMSISNLVGDEVYSIEEKSMNQNNKSHSMAYWGDVVDNTRQVVSCGDMSEIAMIYPLLKSCYEMISMACNNHNPPLLDIKQSNVGRDATVNFGTIQQTTGD